MISNASNVALHSAFSTLCTNVTDGRSQYHTDGKKGFYTKIGSVSRSDDDIVLVVVDSVQLCRQNDETRDKRSTFGWQFRPKWIFKRSLLMARGRQKRPSHVAVLMVILLFGQSNCITLHGWMSEKRLTSHSTDSKLSRTQILPGNHLHWCWQLNPQQ